MAAGIITAHLAKADLRNQIYLMDCMDLMRQIPDGFASMILTDPPYGIGYQNSFTDRKHDFIIGDTGAGIDYVRFASESYRILQNNAHAYFFTRFDCYPYHFQCLKRAGFHIKNCLVIQKATVGGIGDLHGSYANNSEWLIFCQKGRRVFNKTTLLKNRYGLQFKGRDKPCEKYKTRFPACWFGPEYPKANYNSSWQKSHQIFHPTIKNVEFLSWIIQISSLPGELVFDGFMGTGSTALAAIQTGRDYLGAEICEDYFTISQNRIGGCK